MSLWSRAAAIGSAAVLAMASAAFADDVVRTTANNGNLVMEDVPPIPARIVDDLNRYQNVRSAGFRGWTEDGSAIYVTTRFGDLNQIHRVDMPGGARTQLTFYKEPVFGVTRRPGGSSLVFSRDAGGSEFAQLFLLDPATGDATLLTDGESRNGGVVWDRRGERIAYRSTRRDGASNDIWIMDPNEPGAASIALESSDGTLWGPAEFSASGAQLLVTNYVSITDSRVHLVDLDSGAVNRLAGGTSTPSYNAPVAFDDERNGMWFVTDQGGEFVQLAWQNLETDAPLEIVTADIPWNVSGAVISHDRSRLAFVTNEEGMSQVTCSTPAPASIAR